MNHPEEERLLDVYYGDAQPEVHAHLQACEECRARLDQLKETLDGLGEYRVPERGETYGREVWNRIAPELPKVQRRFWYLRASLLTPAIAVLLAIAFAGGFWTEHERARNREMLAFARTRERVLLITMSDHLERAQIVVAELAHANPDSGELSAQRERARDLVEENRLLRQTAVRLGDRSHAALLDDLERVLLSVANAPDAFSSEELTLLQERIARDRLLWKLRIASANSREKGEKL